ncbi:DNA-binding GntR family transcriptional regulator [Arthrobacter sp. BE255]|nr:DNA-binding GntR family transcriptional regulator [Arthrobacter sp. BE255]
MAIARVSAAQVVYERLWEKITTLRLAPGERLNEASLVAELGVSRTPMREAVRRLMSEDLLNQLPTGAVIVRPLDVDHLKQVYRTRSGLEQVIVRQACENITDEQIRQLEVVLEANRHHVRFPDTTLKLGADFHNLIADVAGNEVCRRLLNQLRGHTIRYRTLSNEMPGRLDNVFEEHEELIQALEARDADLAASIMDRHVMAAFESARKAVSQRYPAA